MVACLTLLKRVRVPALLLAFALFVMPATRASATCGDWLQHGAGGLGGAAMELPAGVTRFAGWTLEGTARTSGDLLASATAATAVSHRDAQPVPVRPWTPCGGPGCRRSESGPQAAPVARALRVTEPATCSLVASSPVDLSGGFWSLFSQDTTAREGFPLLLFRPPCA